MKRSKGSSTEMNIKTYIWATELTQDRKTDVDSRTYTTEVGHCWWWREVTAAARSRENLQTG